MEEGREKIGTQTPDLRPVVQLLVSCLSGPHPRLEAGARPATGRPRVPTRRKCAVLKRLQIREDELHLCSGTRTELAQQQGKHSMHLLARLCEHRVETSKLDDEVLPHDVLTLLPSILQVG